jgi:hypothetical protein
VHLLLKVGLDQSLVPDHRNLEDLDLGEGENIRLIRIAGASGAGEIRIRGSHHPDNPARDRASQELNQVDLQPVGPAGSPAAEYIFLIQQV